MKKKPCVRVFAKNAGLYRLISGMSGVSGFVIIWRPGWISGKWIGFSLIAAFVTK
jgi:hypothetical protein